MNGVISSSAAAAGARQFPQVQASAAALDPAGRLAWLLDPQFLAGAGWDAGTLVLSPPPGHLVLGWPVCRIDGCGNAACRRGQLCRSCASRGASDDAGAVTPSGLAAGPESAGALCAVSGCPRAWRSARQPLCRAHLRQRDTMGMTTARFVTAPGVTALREYGPCQVSACVRERTGSRSAYCAPHAMRWRRKRAAEPGTGELRWRRLEPAVFEAGTVSLRGLDARVVAEVLFGLQERSRHGSGTRPASLARVCDAARRAEVTSLQDLPDPACHDDRHLLRALTRHVRVAAADPEAEAGKDVRELAVFGHRGHLAFTRITQPWLRDAAKAWAADDLPRRRGPRAGAAVQGRINAVAHLSDSLRHSRPDHGNIAAQLSRADVDRFLSRLAYLAGRGDLTAATRTRTCQHARTVLGAFRHLGLTRPGSPAAGLPDDVTLARRDVPAGPEDPEPSRDLPAEIIGQLAAGLGELEAMSSRELRIAVELLMDTGRRPDEICALPLDCLTRDSNGEPVLIYQNVKAHRPGRRLPIASATAQLISAQQEQVKARFPATPAGELALLPTRRANPHGKRPVSAVTMSSRHRDWVDSLPPLLSDGTEYDKNRIVPYAYRHSYAQRHADSGVPIDVLRDLMDHADFDVTRGYYRVGEERRREAVDKVTAMQFDRHGNRTWRDTAALLDTEHARYAVGQVAVPYGTCTEPSNVQAGGGACPVRFRCAGCDHFRTGVAFLP
ncbi:MAG: tyrosine-type recombinase/integrase, partial [Streptosporangiaceae bacterium]